jgi:Bacteriophage translational regulator
MQDDIFKGLGVEIKIEGEEAFLKIKETLTRIGVASRKENKLFQSCHILHKQGKYVIIHFKEMFILDGKPSNFSEEDMGRRNKIAELLQDWGLLTVIDPEKIKEPLSPMNQIKVLNYKEKDDWILEAKYQIGRKRTN